MTVDLRPAIAADHDAVAAVTLAAYTPWIERLGRKPGPMADDYGALIADECVHVLELDGAVRGVLVLIPEPTPC